MGKAIIMHVEDAPYLNGEKRKPGEPMPRASQLIGDLDKGPWIHINSIGPNGGAVPHTHSQDEVIFILEGELTMGARKCGPGTVVYIEKDTQYGFKVGPEGVRFLNVRPGLATYTPVGGKERDPYRKSAASRMAQTSA